MQKDFKTRHDLVGKVIHREFCKKLKFDHTNKWFMHNPESVLENETHKVLWYCEIHIDHLRTRPSESQHHHHHVVPLAQISLSLSRHFYLSFIASGRSSGLNPVSSHSCCMYLRAGRPAFAWPYAGVHIETQNTSTLLQEYFKGTR